MKTRRSLGLRSQVHMGTGGQGYGDWTTHTRYWRHRMRPFPEHAGVNIVALGRKMIEL